jgi:hypothetical protein
MSTEKEEKIKEVKADIGKYGALEAIAKMQGGKELIQNLGSDVVSAVENICNKYKEVSHIELISLIARLSERLNLLRTLTRSTKNKKLAREELKNILSE